MTKRITFAGLATAFVLGAGLFTGSSIAGSTSAEAFTLLPGHGHHGHFRDSWRHPRPWGEPRRHWGHRGWGYAPIGYAGFYGGCYTVLKTRFVPGIGLVERPVRRCY